MRHIVIGLTSTLLAVAGIANGQTAETAALEEPTGEIGGIVVSSTTSEPLAGAAVQVSPGSPRGRGQRRRRHRTTTGLDGRFHLTGLTAGEYSVLVDKTGYERRGVLQTTAKLHLAEGEARRNVRIELRPSAVITGRVLDAHSDPLHGARVTTYRRSYHPDRSRWSSAGSATSNDLGEYRIYGLAPGKYAVRARPPRETAPPGILYYESAVEFYPGVPEADQAALIRVSWGSEVSAVDFELGAAPDTSLGGVALDGDTGKPCPCFLRVSGDDGQGHGQIMAGPEGLFAFRGLAPGSYYISASPGGHRSARLPVQVTESPTDDIALVTTDGLTVSGEVVFEDREDMSEDQPSDSEERPRPLQVVLTDKIEVNRTRRTSIPAPQTSGLFEISRLLSGPYRISLRNLPTGGYLRAVTLGGRRLDKPEITVAPDTSVSGVKLEIARDGAAVRGAVKPPDGMTADEVSTGWVVVIPDKTDGYQYRGRLRLDTDASFTLPGMPPGGYTLYSVPAPDTFDLWDPQVRRALKASGKRVRLSAEDQVSVELLFIPEPAEPL